jgi:hypothetical protein
MTGQYYVQVYLDCPRSLSCCAWLVIRKLTNGDSSDRYCTPEMFAKNLDDVSTSRNWRSTRMMMRRIKDTKRMEFQPSAVVKISNW